MSERLRHHLSSTGTKADRTLFLVFSPVMVDWQDVRDIAERVVALDSRIAIHVATPGDSAAAVPPDLWNNRCITVSIGTAGRFVPRRGPMLSNAPIPKLDQFHRFRAAGIATPMTARFEFGKRYDEEVWTEFVVLKPLPLSMTSKSGWSHLYRTARLAQLSPATLAPDHFLRKGPALVQSLIDTGLYPSKWRVLSFLGEALYSSRTTSVVPRAALDASDEELEASIIDAKNPYSTAADPQGRRNRLEADPEVLAFARRIHAAFPRVPLLGLDILRRESDGKLFALEINAGGNVWHFSSRKEGHRKRLGGRAAMVAQFDAWTVAARALVRHTDELAA